MKKILSLALVLILALSVFAGCGSSEKDYSLAIGIQTSNDLSSAKSSQTAAVVVADKDGKIVACRIDAIDFESKEKDGAAVTTLPISKAEQKDDYNMVALSQGAAIAEWYKQAEAFETYVAGKTLAEVKATAIDANGKPTDAELTAGCTISVTDFILAIDKAFASANKVNFKASGNVKLGVSAKATNVKYSKDTAKYSFECDYSGVATVGDKVVSAIIDSTEVSATTTKNENGKISATKMDYKGTKLEQGANYGMVKFGNAKAEWYVQAQTYANTAVGKTGAELASLAVKDIAGCTINVEGYKIALEAAAKAAR